MQSFKANVGRMAVNNIFLDACETINVRYENLGHFWALLILAKFCLSKVDEETIKKIKGIDNTITVDLVSGYRGGGIEPVTFTGCKLESIDILSQQGKVVWANIILSKRIFDKKE